MIVSKPMPETITKGKNWVRSHIIAVIATIIVCIIFFKSCFNNPTPALVITPVKEQIKVQVRDEVAMKKQADSFLLVVNKYQNIAVQKEKEFEALQYVNLGLQQDMNEYLLKEIPDTCKPYQQALIALNKKLSQFNIGKDKACVDAINAQKDIVAQKDAFLEQKDKNYAKLRSSLDTCFKYSMILENEVKKNKPQREIAAGVDILGSQIKPLTAYGIALSLKNTKGTTYAIGAYQMGSTTLYKFGVSKTILKIKKHKL